MAASGPRSRNASRTAVQAKLPDRDVDPLIELLSRRLQRAGLAKTRRVQRLAGHLIAGDLGNDIAMAMLPRQRSQLRQNRPPQAATMVTLWIYTESSTENR